MQKKFLKTVFKCVFVLIPLVTLCLISNASAAAPIVASSSPADNEIDVSPIGNIVITFDQPVTFDGSGTVKIYKSSDNSLIQTYDTTSFYDGVYQISLSGAVLTIDPHVPLGSDTDYYLTISENWIKNGANEYYGGMTDGGNTGITNLYAYNFKTELVPSPAPIAFTPADNSLEVDLDTNLVVTFNQAMELIGGAGSLKVYETVGDVLVATYNYNDPNLSIFNNVLTIDPPTDLDPNTEYYIHISGDLVQTVLTHEAYVGISNSTTWNFDTQAIYSPPDDSTAVDGKTNLTITFADDIYFGGGSLQIRETSNNTLVGTYYSWEPEVTIVGNQLIIDPRHGFKGGVQYYVEISSGFIYKSTTNTPYPGIDDDWTAIKGANPNGISDAYKWNFTIDTTLDPWADFFPADDSTGANVATNLVVTYDEHITRGTTGSVTIKKVSDDSTFETYLFSDTTHLIFTDDFGGPKSYTMTINPTALMDDFTEYYVLIDSGVVVNPYTGADAEAVTAPSEDLETYEWNFTTGTAAPPAIIYLWPEDNSIDALLDTDLIIRFDQNVILDSGTLQIIRMSDDTVIETYNQTQMTVSGNEITVPRTASFANLTQYYVNISSGLIQSQDTGVYFGGIIEDYDSPDITNAYIWNFESIEQNPFVISFSPPDESTGVDVKSNFVVTFNETIDDAFLGWYGDGIRIRRYDNDEIVAQSSSYYEYDGIYNLNITLSGAQLIIDPLITLLPNTHYYIQIDPGVIYGDTSELPFLGFTDNETWDFETGAAQPPEVITFSPPDNSSGVSVVTNLVVTFDEYIQSTATGTFEIWEYVDGGAGDILFASYGPGNSEVVFNTANRTVTVNPATELLGHTSYYVKISNDFVESHYTGENYAGIYDTTTWNFTTGDYLDPNYLSLFPANYSTGNPIDTNFSITFDRNVKNGGSGTFSIYDQESNLIHTYNWDDPNLSFVADTLFVTSVVDLAPNKWYYIDVSNGLVQNAEAGVGQGGLWNGIYGYYDWRFYTILAAPEWVSFSPPDESTNVDTRTEMIVTFNEPVYKSGAGNVTIRKKSDNSIIVQYPTASGHLRTSGNTLIIDPDYVAATATVLPGNTDIYVQITSGVIQNAQAFTYPGFTDNETWDFTTGANQVPLLVSFTPPDNATNVLRRTNYTMRFNEPVSYGGSGNFTIHKMSDNSVVGTYTDADMTFAGTLVTVNFDESYLLDFDETYYVNFSPSLITGNISGMNHGGIANNSTWNFNTETAPPLVTNFSPADDFASVSAGSNLVITFDRAIQEGYGAYVRVRRTADNSVYAQNDPDGTYTDFQTDGFHLLNTSIAGNQYIIDGAVFLESDTQYYLEIEGSLITGSGTGLNFCVTAATCGAPNDPTSGIDDPWVGPSDTYTWNFTTSLAPPAVIDFDPNDNSGLSPYVDPVVDIDSNLVVTFDQNVVLNAVSGADIKVHWDGSVQRSNGNQYYSYAAGDLDVSVSGNTLTINPRYQLPPNRTIHVTITNNIIKSPTTYLFYPGIDDTTTWNFLTEQHTPIVIEFDPPDESTNVSVISDFVAYFSDDMAFAVTGSATLKRYADNTVVVSYGTGVSEVSIFENRLTIDPSITLSGNVQHYWTITPSWLRKAGTDGTGLYDNFIGFTDNETWDFNTESVTAPIVIDYTPDDGATAVSTTDNLVLQFDQMIANSGTTGNVKLYKTTGNVLVETFAYNSPRLNFSGDLLIIDPTSALEAFTAYYVQVTNDLVSNTNASAYYSGIGDTTTWNFDTGVSDIPMAIQFIPPDEETGVSIGANLQIIFDQNIQFDSGSLTIKQYSDNAVVDSFTQASGALSVSGNTLTINPTSNLSNATRYYIEISSNLIASSANPSFYFVGLSGNEAWDFFTVYSDATRPNVTALSPLDNSIDNSLTENLTITFDENIQKGTGLITIYDATDDSTFETIDVNSGLVTISGAVATINPFNDFSGGANYYVTVDAGTFTDSSFNAYLFNAADSITAPTDWNFNIIVPDVTAPELISTIPVSSSTDVDVTTNLQMTFNENMAKGAGSIYIYSNAGSTLEEVISVNDARVTITGAVVNIDSADFPYAENMVINLDDGALEDTSGNWYIPDYMYDWSFSTQNEPLSIINLVPADDATGVSLGTTTLTATFNSNIGFYMGGTIELRKSDTTVVASYTESSPALSISGANLIIDISGVSLQYGTGYYVTISDSLVYDITSSEYNTGLTDPTFWNFTTVYAPVARNISGTVYTDQGITTMGAGRTVTAAVNGVDSGIINDTDGSGNYTLTGVTFALGDVLTIYLEDETEDAVTVTVGPNANLTGINLHQNTLITRHDNGGVMTNAFLDTGNDGADSDVTNIYADGGGSTLDLGQNLYIPSSMTFTPGGNITIGGDWHNEGTFTPNTHNVTFDGSSDQSIYGNNLFYDLSGTGGTTRSIYIEASSNQEIEANGSIDFQGDGSNDLFVRPTGSDTNQWTFIFGAGSTQLIDNLRLIQQKFNLAP